MGRLTSLKVPARCPWASFLSTVGLDFIIYKMSTPAARDCHKRVKWVLSSQPSAQHPLRVRRSALAGGGVRCRRVDGPFVALTFLESTVGEWPGPLVRRRHLSGV